MEELWPPEEKKGKMVKHCLINSTIVEFSVFTDILLLGIQAMGSKNKNRSLLYATPENKSTTK